MKPLRMVERIERDPKRPGYARLQLSCGHYQEVHNFPRGTPPPCFRRECEVEGCCNA